MNDRNDTGVDEDELTEKEIEYFRGKLREARNDLLSRNQERLADTLEAKSWASDEADHAEADRAQQFELRLADKDRKLLSLIDHALEKITKGDYGLCEGTGDPIARARLELRPWARYSVGYKMVLERERAMHVKGG